MFAWAGSGRSVNVQLATTQQLVEDLLVAAAEVAQCHTLQGSSQKTENKAR